MRARLRALVLAVVVALVVASCASLGGSPPPRPTATCVLLRAFSPSGKLDEVCATIEDLAPLIGEIIARHAAASAPPPASARPVLAFSLSSPPVVERRRCVSWERVELGGGSDSGTGGSQ